MFKLDQISYHIEGGKTPPLLGDISVRVPRGAMTAIMGLNGAGKTTLLKVMSGCLRPSVGQLHVGSPSKRLAQKVTFVPQDFPTDFPFTVAEFVMMGRFVWQDGLFNRPQDHEKVHQVLSRLSLSGFETRLISTLSGGERQRVLIARALVQETEAILLDEPVNHLDIKNKIEILDLLKEENQKNGKTIIAVMHDFHDVQKYFDQTLMLKDGRLKYYGVVREGFLAERLHDIFDVDVSRELINS